MTDGPDGQPKPKTKATVKPKTKPRAVARPSSGKAGKAGKKRSTKVDELSAEFIEAVRQRIHDGRMVRRRLPVWGRLHIDRQLPFLCIYRKPRNDTDQETSTLFQGQAACLFASGDRRSAPHIQELVRAIVREMVEAFGSCLVLEMWSTPDEEDAPREGPAYRPWFRIVHHKREDLGETVDTLRRWLEKIRIKAERAAVDVGGASRIHPPGMRPLLSPEDCRELGCRVLGLQVRPIYRIADGSQAFPLVLRTLRRGISRGTRRAFFEFTRARTTHRPPHFHSLGRRSMVKAVWEVDRRMAEISDAFDFLLLASPTNSEDAWKEFKRTGFEKTPVFRYRPIPVDPLLAKRQLFEIPVERIEDPSLERLFREQQLDIDRMLTMLWDRTTPRFLLGSLAVHGAVNDKLLGQAQRLLRKLPPSSGDESAGGSVTSKTFARRAEQELAYYREQMPSLKSKVEIRDDISGLMVNRGQVLVGKGTRIPAGRVEALISHEVGTHVVTYWNGQAQPLRQLHAGLPGYEALQEGLAVFSEYLVGGLGAPRLRLLAARVIAARAVQDGGSFVDIYRELTERHGFTERASFMITMRVCRGGGMTKDAVYLRGLIDLLEYLRKGGKFDSLLIGKIAEEHVPIVQELRWRKILARPPLRPRYFENEHALRALAAAQAGLGLMDLVKPGHPVN